MSTIFNKVFSSSATGASQAKSKSPLSKKYRGTSFTNPKLVWDGEVFDVKGKEEIKLYQLRVPTGMFTKHASNAKGIQVYKVVKVLWKKEISRLMVAEIPDYNSDGNIPQASAALVVELEEGVYTVVRVNTNVLFTFICDELRVKDVPTTFTKEGIEVSDWKEMLLNESVIYGKDLTFKQAIINLFTGWERAISEGKLEVMFPISYKAYESQDDIENIILLRDKEGDKYPTVKDNPAALKAFIANNK